MKNDGLKLPALFSSPDDVDLGALQSAGLVLSIGKFDGVHLGLRALLHRMQQRGSAAQMPPLGTRTVDQAGSAAVRAFIASLPREAASSHRTGEGGR